jgi:hypothetical protein
MLDYVVRCSRNSVNNRCRDVRMVRHTEASRKERKQRGPQKEKESGGFMEVTRLLVLNRGRLHLRVSALSQSPSGLLGQSLFVLPAGTWRGSGRARGAAGKSTLRVWGLAPH